MRTHHNDVILRQIMTAQSQFCMHGGTPQVLRNVVQQSDVLNVHNRASFSTAIRRATLCTGSQVIKEWISIKKVDDVD